MISGGEHHTAEIYNCMKRLHYILLLHKTAAGASPPLFVCLFVCLSIISTVVANGIRTINFQRLGGKSRNSHQRKSEEMETTGVAPAETQMQHVGGDITANNASQVNKCESENFLHCVKRSSIPAFYFKCS